jgi:hypothetical protein
MQRGIHAREPGRILRQAEVIDAERHARMRLVQLVIAGGRQRLLLRDLLRCGLLRFVGGLSRHDTKREECKEYEKPFHVVTLSSVVSNITTILSF